MIPFKSWWTK